MKFFFSRSAASSLSQRSGTNIRASDPHISEERWITQGFTDRIVPSVKVRSPMVMPPVGTLRGKPTIMYRVSYQNKRCGLQSGGGGGCGNTMRSLLLFAHSLPRNLGPDERLRGSGETDKVLNRNPSEEIEAAPGTCLLGTGVKNRSASLMQAWT